jgi:aldehyde dehydrogenase (NAD+)
MASLSARIFIRATNRELEIPTGLFIDNEFVPSAASANEFIQYDISLPFADKDCNPIEPCSAVNPATEETICTVVAGNYVTPICTTETRKLMCPDHQARWRT